MDDMIAHPRPTPSPLLGRFPVVQEILVAVPKSTIEAVKNARISASR